jgi:hypothetical protein
MASKNVIMHLKNDNKFTVIIESDNFNNITKIDFKTTDRQHFSVLEPPSLHNLHMHTH